MSKERKNYVVTSDVNTIIDYLKIISDKRPNVKIVIIDTISTIMSDKEMADRKKVGYDKWYEYAADIYELYSVSQTLRDDLIVIFCAHAEEYTVDGVTYMRTKTGGQKLSRLNLNGKLTYNLYTTVEMNGNNPSFGFVTQNLGTTEARSPYGVLPLKMSNDMYEVIARVRKYDLGIEDELTKTIEDDPQNKDVNE